MAFYKVCSSGKCDQPNPNPSLKPGGKKGNPADMIYQCVSNTTTPCPPNATTSCKCFVVVTHHNYPGWGADDAEVDQDYYPAAPDSTAADPYKGMLTEAERIKKYPKIGRIKGGGDRQEYWLISCRCLQVNTSGDPLTALRVIITVPGQAYASTLRDLEKKYGAANVSLIPPPADAPERRKANRRKLAKAGRTPAAKAPARKPAKKAKKRARS